MSEIYRDPTEGAAAKRQELLRRRRDELVTMPHAVRRVVVARSARIAASIAVILGGTALLMTTASPSLTAWMARGLPGIQPAVLSTLLSMTWILGIGVYALARGRVEHRFAVEMSRYVLPGTDLDLDIERLDHEHPDEVAKQMAHRLEVRSAALPVLAAAIVLPATALYAVQAWRTHGWPIMSEYEVNLATHSGGLIAVAVAGVVGAIVMTRRSARLPAATMVALPFAVVTAGLAVAVTIKAPGHTAWALFALSAISGTIGIIARRLRIERDLIAAEDPAAGSELFTLRGFVRQIRSTLASLHATLNAHYFRQRLTRRVAIGALFVGGSLASVAAYARRAPHAAQPALAALQPQAIVPTNPEPGSFATHDAPYHASLTADGRIKIDVVLDGGAPVDVPSLLGLAMLPPNWQAHVTIALAENAGSGVIVTAFPNDPNVVPQQLDTGGSATFSTKVCDGHTQPIGLRVLSGHPERGTITATLYVQPALGVAVCP